MSTTDLLNALLAKKGQDYFNEFSAFMTQLLADNAGILSTAGQAVTSASTTSLAIGTGAKSLTVAANKAFAAGQPVTIAVTADVTKYMVGSVTSYDATTGALAVSVSDAFGSGTFAAWTVSLTGTRGLTGPAGGISGGDATGAINETAVTVASASTTDIGAAAGNAVRVTGTTTITALGTAQSGARRHVTFSGALTLTHNATSLILPGAANITTAAGDTAEFESLGGSNWRCVAYSRASGVALPAVGNALVVPVTGKYVSVNWNSTITIDLTAGNVFAVTLGGATTFANPTITSAMIGMEVHIIAKQDATGGRTIGLGSYFKFPLSTTPTWSTTASKTDHLVGIVVSTTEIHVTGIVGY
ncbi:hypothetical protein [Azospirillum sp.]|uniref:hypothetical protein n=1 Tax=Azospirillum sp. TaxID=34012 RepID=UPI002D4E7017|nr:hypothetical protein [Azospirillum sp.]HYF88967.1 hypothetical protein [Azospirillum sp.]